LIGSFFKRPIHLAKDLPTTKQHPDMPKACEQHRRRE
jgi:hypothetical protein